MTFSVIPMLVDMSDAEAKVRFMRSVRASAATWDDKGRLRSVELNDLPPERQNATQDKRSAAKPPDYRKVILASGSSLRPGSREPQ